MNTIKSPKSSCFIGNRGIFAATVLDHLLQEGVSISQVFCASSAPATAPENTLPVTQPTQKNRLDSIAQRHNIPVTYIANQSELNSLDIQEYTKADFMLVACFPYCLPNSFINWPKLACLNIHPSLLPKYRGPDPLFWQLQNDESQTGVSLHLITPQLDAGPVINQKKCTLNDGASRNDIETTLAKMGAEGFRLLLTKDITKAIKAEIQDEAQASYHPNPSISDYTISLDWSARHAFNFVRGTTSPTGYYTIISNAKLVKIMSTV